ncbi:hypothetical protein GSI_14294 [Ganoderma sinense ZZ0214-1]|uniref:Transporter n=1 Tax=Ganoderma sinense ZZ0214-1 TaxID=1077348 RepID=A0A2G8RN97_9APHY|nr:hypothetical protein GSI_14294 [Ganoderma sinense ZZ0214-1]
MIAILITVLIAFLVAQAIAAAALILAKGDEQEAERREEDDAQPDNTLGLFWDGGPMYPYDTLTSLDKDDASFADLQPLPPYIPNYTIPDDDDYPLPDDE